MRKWFVGVALMCVFVSVSLPALRVVAQVVPCSYGVVLLVSGGFSVCAGTPSPVPTPTATAAGTAPPTTLPSPATTATDLKAPQIRQATNYAPNSASGVVPFVLATPPSYADILVAAITTSLTSDPSRTIIPPANWQPLDPQLASSYNSFAAMSTWYHVVFGPESGSYTFFENSPSGTNQLASGVLYDIYGQDPANPIGAHAIGTNYNIALYLPGGALTKPNVAHTLSLAFWGMDGGSTVSNESIPLGAASSPFIIDEFAYSNSRATISAHATNITAGNVPYTTASITNDMPYVTALDNIQPLGAPTPPPTNTPTPSPTPTATPTPAVTPTPTTSPTPIPTSSVGPSPNASDQLYDSYASDTLATTPNFVQSINYNSLGPTQWQIYSASGTNVFGEPSGSGAQPEDIAYYNLPTPLSSLSMTYTFVYSGPGSVVEPFILTSTNPPAGYNINLTQSYPGNTSAGVATLFNSTFGNTTIGRLHTEPYFYQTGHRYLVNVVADQATGVLSTSVNDVVNGGSLTFDKHLTPIASGTTVYPGIWNVNGGATEVTSIAFGPSGNLPMFPQSARSAYAFNDMLGLNASTNAAATALQATAESSYVPSLRIKHMRVTGFVSYQPAQNALEAACTALAVPNYSCDETALMSPGENVAYLTGSLLPAMSTPPETYEMLNEPNTSENDPNWLVDVPQTACQFYNSMQNGVIPQAKIFGPSLVAIIPGPMQSMAPETFPTSSPYPCTSPIASYLTAWNVHDYEYINGYLPEEEGVNTNANAHLANPTPLPIGCGASGHEDCGYNYTVNEYLNSSSQLALNLPGVSTEGQGSYGSSLNQNICSQDVSYNTEQAYIQRGYLQGFLSGKERVYPFLLEDFGVAPYPSPCSAGFNSYGLLYRINNPDSTPQVIAPKPGYTALAYFLQLLYDAGSNAPTYTPSPLSYSLTGGTPDVRTLLLGASDGSYRLVVWSDNPLCVETSAPCTSSAVTNSTVTLHLASTAAIAVFQQAVGATPTTIGSGAWSITSSTTGTSATFTANNYATIVDIVPGTSATPEPLPTGIPTPGPGYETPMLPTPSPMTSPTAAVDYFDADPTATMAPGWVAGELAWPFAVSTYAPYSAPNSFGEGSGGNQYDWAFYPADGYAPEIEEELTFEATNASVAPVAYKIVSPLNSTQYNLNISTGALSNVALVSGSGETTTSLGTVAGSLSSYTVGQFYTVDALFTYTGSSVTIQLRKPWLTASATPPPFSATTTLTTYLHPAMAPGFLLETPGPVAIDNFEAAYNGAPLQTPSPSPTPSPTPTSTPSPMAYQNFILAQSPTFFHEMNETSGSSAIDASGNGNTGTYVAPFALATSGPCCGNSAVTFSQGTTGSVNGQLTTAIAGSSSIFNSSFTIGFASYQPTSYQGFGTIWLMGTDATENGAGNGFDMTYGNNNSSSTAGYNFYWYFGGSSNQVTYVSPILSGWHFWSLVVDKTTSNNVILYLDGSPVETKAIGTFQAAAGRYNLSFGNGQADDGASNDCNCSTTLAYLVPHTLTPQTVATAYALASATFPTPTPSPSPTPAPLGPPTVGAYATAPAKQALCVNVAGQGNTVFLNALATSPPGYGSASGDFIGEFGDAGYTKALLDATWGVTTQRVGTVGSSFSGVQAHLTGPVTIPAAGGSVTISVDTAAPSGVATGNVITVGTTNTVNGSSFDPMVIQGTLSTGYGTTSWTLTNVYAYPQGTPPSTATTIPLTSTANGTSGPTDVYANLGYASWNGYVLSFGHSNGQQYDFYLGSVGDGTGLTDPHAIANDTSVSGSPQALQLSAQPIPNSLMFPADSATLEYYTASSTAQDLPTSAWPAAGSTLTVSMNSATANTPFNNETVGFRVGGKLVIGFLESGGRDQNTQSGGGSPWVIADVQYPDGVPTVDYPSGSNGNIYTYQNFYTGSIDKDISLQYGFVQADLRTLPSEPGVSPAFWTLQSQAGVTNTGYLSRDEQDLMEQFGNQLGSGLNAGGLLYGVIAGGNDQSYWQGDASEGGAYNWPSWQPSGSAPSTSYHSYGGMFLPGGSPTFPQPPYTGSNTNVNGTYTPTAGQSMYLDGEPLTGHTGTTDLTQGVADKEVMATFQTLTGGDFDNLGANVTTTTSSFVVPSAAFTSSVVVPVASTSGWVQQIGNEYDITDSSGHLMQGLLIGISGNNLTFYAKAETSGGSSFGATMATGATVRAKDGALSQSWPQYFWVQWLRAYAPTAYSC